MIFLYTWFMFLRDLQSFSVSLSKIHTSFTAIAIVCLEVHGLQYYFAHACKIDQLYAKIFCAPGDLIIPVIH